MNGNAAEPVSIEPADTTMELKCVVAIPVIRYLDAEFGKERAAEIIADTRMDVAYLRDAHNWISFEYFTSLLDKLVEVTGNERAPFEAAKMESDLLSYRSVALFLKHLGTPGDLYRLVVKYHHLWDKICVYDMLNIGVSSCTISVEFPSHSQTKNNCIAIQGSLAAAPHAFGRPSATVRELQCACDGEKKCVYELRWLNRPARLWGWITCAAAVCASLAAVCMYGDLPKGVAATVVVLSVVMGYSIGRRIDYSRKLADVYGQNVEQACSLLESMKDIEDLNAELQRKVVERTEELARANDELGQAMQDLRTSQEKVIVAEKRAAVGVLAGGMAHEINNPVNAIRLSLQTLLEECADDEKLRPRVETALRATKRCSRIVGELLSFSRDPSPTSRADLASILDTAVAVFRMEDPGEVHVDITVQPGLPSVFMDKLQIQQAILNVLSNAADAMNKTGRIAIDLSLIDEELVLSISDEGPGMSDEVKRHLFEPFFSTKGSWGKGLGMAITYQLVTRNGGNIEVDSAENSGTTFLLHFPIRS